MSTPLPDLLASLQARIPAWANLNLRVHELTGGMTNLNYRVEAGGGTYVLRLGGNDTHLLGIDRDAEYAANLQAADLGIAPPVVAFLQPEQYLVTRFVAGQPIPPERIREPALLAQITTALRRFHQSPPIPGFFSPFRIAETYADLARERGVRLPTEAAPALAQAQRIETALYGDAPLSLAAARGTEIVPCHNDLLNGNFLDEAGLVRILDWEYAGMGDLYFDLANFSANHDFNDDEDRALLTAYFASPPNPAHFARLRLMRIMSNLREAMWGVVQQGISTIDFDFADYAADYFARLATGISNPHYDDWLQEASHRT